MVYSLCTTFSSSTFRVLEAMGVFALSLSPDGKQVAAAGWGTMAAYLGRLDEALLAEVVERSGKCDILVNGAGVNSATPFLEVAGEEYDRIMELNTRAVFFACQVFGAYFIENGIEASIIN